MRPRHGLGLNGQVMHPPLHPPLDQAGPLQHLQVLGDRRKRDLVGGGELGHRGLTGRQPLKQRTAGGMGEGGERLVERKRRMFNHMVYYMEG